jgi:hypothetical protein
VFVVSTGESPDGTSIRKCHLFLYGSTALVDLGPLFLVLNYTQAVGLLGSGISASQGRYLHTEQHQHGINAHRHACLEWESNPRSQCSTGRRWLMPLDGTASVIG